MVLKLILDPDILITFSRPHPAADMGARAQSVGLPAVVPQQETSFQAAQSARQVTAADFPPSYEKQGGALFNRLLTTTSKAFLNTVLIQ